MGSFFLSQALGASADADPAQADVLGPRCGYGRRRRGGSGRSRADVRAVRQGPGVVGAAEGASGIQGRTVEILHLEQGLFVREQDEEDGGVDVGGRELEIEGLVEGGVLHPDLGTRLLLLDHAAATELKNPNVGS